LHAFSVSHVPPHSAQVISLAHPDTVRTDKKKRVMVKDTMGLTVLEGAARVSISSWVTQTLPDGYKGTSPRDGAAAGLVVEVR